MKYIGAAIGMPLLLGGCSATPLSYLSGSGPAARSIASLGWGLIAIASGATLVVLILLIYAIGRGRAPYDIAVRSADDSNAISWIVTGTGVSTVFLMAAAIWTLWVVDGVSNTSKRPAVTVDVTGNRWWWKIQYTSEIPERAFTTANELVIPVGVPVQINLRSDDVIHSFWVPKLAGKTDTIPGTTNVAHIEADVPGVYRGQCTEFCGLQHAHMGFEVIALKQDEFQQWWNQQLQSVAPLETSKGQQVFVQRCAACHAVRGLPAGGILGPDLSHFGGRRTIGAGTLPNNPTNLAYWIDHTQVVKPGSKMPILDLPPDEVSAVTEFLEGLR